MNAAAAAMSLSQLVNRRRLGLLARFASTQMAVQLIGFLAGVVLVRCMEPTQYGYYTLALSMAGVAAVLGELGLASAVMALGGQLLSGRAGAAAPQAAALGQLVEDAERLRRRLALLPVLVVVPACMALLLGQQAPPWQAAVLTALVLAVAAVQVRGSLSLSVVRLLGRVGWQQKLDLGVNLGKLLAVAAVAQLVLDATVACAVNLAAAALALILMQRALVGPAPKDSSVAGDYLVALRQHVWRQAPNSIYYVASSQIAVWLIGTFGSAERVAEVGALGRLSALFALIAAVSAALVLPYFARRKPRAELRRGLWLINMFFALLMATLLTLGWLVPGVLLWVLGGHYGGLQTELNWMLAAGTLAAWGGTLYSVGCARGWVLPFWVNAPLGMAATVGAALLVDVSTVRGAFLINTATALAGLVAAAAYLGWQLRRPDQPSSADREAP